MSKPSERIKELGKITIGGNYGENNLLNHEISGVDYLKGIMAYLDEQWEQQNKYLNGQEWNWNLIEGVPVPNSFKVDNKGEVKKQQKLKHRMYCGKSGLKCLVYHSDGICPDVKNCEACKAGL